MQLAAHTPTDTKHKPNHARYRCSYSTQVSPEFSPLNAATCKTDHMPCLRSSALATESMQAKNGSSMKQLLSSAATHALRPRCAIVMTTPVRIHALAPTQHRPFVTKDTREPSALSKVVTQRYQQHQPFSRQHTPHCQEQAKSRCVSNAAPLSIIIQTLLLSGVAISAAKGSNIQ
jgi:hypothetical protein